MSDTSRGNAADGGGIAPTVIDVTDVPALPLMYRRDPAPVQEESAQPPPDEPTDRYVRLFPGPLLRDFVRGRWLPIVGAGMSANAETPPDCRMPLWDDLGKALANEIEGYDPYRGALDAISAYAQVYSRSKLVERVAAELFIGKAKPGKLHDAFCSIPFDIVCTTNIDLLLEQQYARKVYCRPVIDEDQLSTLSSERCLYLIKVHGDLHHPKRLVLTEEDYDVFLDQNPLLATYLANLLINRTAVLIGYSLDDPDLRQLWQVIQTRLGKLRHLAYCIKVGASAAEVARFERRGVMVINLPPEPGRTQGDILADVFGELRRYLARNLIQESKVTVEKLHQELVLPENVPTRICYFAVPPAHHSFYRNFVFPVFERAGLVPVVEEDLQSGSGNVTAEIDVLIERAALVVVHVDDTSPDILFEMRLALGNHPRQRVLIVQDKASWDMGELWLGQEGGVQLIEWPREAYTHPDDVVEPIRTWLRRLGPAIRDELAKQPPRLLAAGDYNAAVVAAVTMAEATLLRCVWTDPAVRPSSSGYLLQVAREHVNTDPSIRWDEVEAWLTLRNRILHHGGKVSFDEAAVVVASADVVNGQLTDYLQRPKGATPSG